MLRPRPPLMPGPSHPTRPRAGATMSGQPAPRRDPVDEGAAAGSNSDSITLGQLKAHKEEMKEKQKTYLFDYRYDDTDTLMNELEEFYPYVEMPALQQSPQKFAERYKKEWTESTSAERKRFIELQLESLESPRHDIRRASQESLLYILQGCFGETTSPEMQLHWVIDNARIVRSVDGVATLVVALRDALRRYHDASEAAADPQAAYNQGQGPMPVDPYDDRSAELMDVLAMLYFMVEVFRSDEDFGEELMAMTPPLPIVLMQMIASLKDKLPKGFPVKKVLLLVWKVLLACLGGMKEVSKAKNLAREVSGLPTVKKDFTKSSPYDITSWRRDTSIKYPTFAPPPSTTVSIPNEKLAETQAPIPARPNYHSTDIRPPSPRTIVTFPLPATPAPSPPPSPVQKQKKQQFQTDPTKPFVFPYSHVNGSGGAHSLVPFAIAEADRLYHQHIYVPLSLYQLWQTREECQKEERGMGQGGLIGFERSEFDEEEETDQQFMLAEWKYEAEEMEQEANANREGVKAAKEKRLAAKRLRRADAIYKSTLPIMQSCIVVLLKLLLATVTGPPINTANVDYTMANPAFTSPSAEHPGASNYMEAKNPVSPADAQERPPPEPALPPPSKEEIDMNRHREITSKAVSAILLLLLKWFKVSHAMKGQLFAQLLFDSNCLLLVLKMFGLNDVYVTVQAKNEIPEMNFFRYCQLNCSKSPPRPEEEVSPLLAPIKPKMSPAVEGEPETEIVSEYSWRNFFSAINFLKVLQKMTKHRIHRTFMLTQYKSSQILKRVLRVNHPMMQLQALKLIKSQMPHCGRKWRSMNMKVITSIYLNCRPELRDDYLGGNEQELEPEESHPQELALRSLIQFYNKRHYPTSLAPPQGHESRHNRSNSINAVTLDDPAIHHHHQYRLQSMSEHDVFPPRKTDLAMPYNPDVMIEFWLHEYEDVLYEVFGDAETPDEGDDYGVRGVAERDGPAWKMLGDLMRSRGGADEDAISDSESVVTVGELGEDARLDTEQGGEIKENHMGENTWEHMSPKTLSLLPRSPAERRRSSSSGSPLRPIMLPQLDFGGLTISDPFDDLDAEGEVDLRGPMPIERETGDEQERSFGAVDEVEYAYGE